ncbi:MAG: chromate transporter [Oscillospiraceae bacterium]|nr:chromate transporter [Oscillospiraceae bacterium]
MILLKLFLGFLRVGFFAFGGAYAAIPFMREVIMDYGWITEEKFSYFVAVAESTPGPVMVNLATYVGASQAGAPGALLATLGTVLPSFVIMLLITVVFKKFVSAPRVNAVLSAIKPCVVGIIIATGLLMLFDGLGISFAGGIGPDIKAVVIAAVLWAVCIVYKKVKKKAFSPILVIAISAVLGIVLYGI